MEKRVLGKTGMTFSVVGFGGIVVKDEEPASASRIVAQAIERGINYFDVAPSYGNAEERLGPALEPYRKSVYLACKTTDRTKQGAAAELRRSLQRLRTDYFDLYQFHSVRSMEDVERILGPDGALEAVLEAQREGLVRHIGFSAHDEDAALALLERFDFASVLFPLNWVCWHRGNFGPRLLARAHEKGMGILALKTLAKRAVKPGEAKKWLKCWYIPVEDPEEALMAFRFTFSRPVTAGTSPSHAELLWWMCDAAERFTPLSEAEEAQVAQLSEGLEPIFPH